MFFAAGLRALRREEQSDCHEIKVTFSDMSVGLNSVQPSAMREVAIEVPNVSAKK